jgi:hypothetical protein
MSAYGVISKAYDSESPLPATRWSIPDKGTGPPISIDLYHLTLEAALKSPGLVEYLHSVFAQIVEDGRTYPMEVAQGEEYSREAFESYFFAGDVIVGVLADERNGDGRSVDCHDGVEIIPGTNSPFGASRDNQSFAWEDVIAGFYYVGCLFLLSSVRKTVTDVGDAQRSNQTTQVCRSKCTKNKTHRAHGKSRARTQYHPSRAPLTPRADTLTSPGRGFLPCIGLNRR